MGVPGVHTGGRCENQRLQCLLLKLRMQSHEDCDVEGCVILDEKCTR